MEYMLLIYMNEQDEARLSPEQLKAVFAEYGALTDSITTSRHYIAADPLQPTSLATTVRVRDGKMHASQGPFAQTHEQLGGYYKIEAKDLDEATAIAARIPGARYGSVEIRPIMRIPARV